MINVLFRPVEALNNPDWILQLLFRKRCSWLPSASHASAPSGNDEAVYAEVHETPAEKFSMNENACYEGIKSCSAKSTDFKKENSLAHDQPCKGVLVVLMMALLLLLYN